MSPRIRIGNTDIGPEHPTYFVADIAANHDGDLDRAKALIRSCAQAGADAAKFQNFRAETIVSDLGFKTLGAQTAHQAKWKTNVIDVYRAASLPMEWTRALQEECARAGIEYMTAPYDLTLIDDLSPFVAAWKLGSGDITWTENIERLADDGKPLLIATGAADMDDVRLAVRAASKHTSEIVLMQCNTNYTGSLENFRHIALNVLKTYAHEFPDFVLGLSDHTPAHATVLGAVALGASVIEKHYTDDRDREGPDHGFSMDPVSWKEMVDRTRELELALGPEDKRVMENELETVVVQRRAVRAAAKIAKGHLIRKEDVSYLRPCPTDALPPFRDAEVIGKTANREISFGDCIRPTDVE